VTSERILVTGASGFIGSTLIAKLFQSGFTDLIGVDNFSAPYGSEHCERRSKALERKYNFPIHRIDLVKNSSIESLREFAPFNYVLHLAAWPGVRYGQEQPTKYYQNNVNAFGNILSLVNEVKPKKFLFASSSSVYGNQGSRGPVSENELSGRDLRSFYATTKLMNEISAQSFAQISKIPTIALRLFTVYGPGGRPDMAYWKFLDSILNNKEIELFGADGGMRSFTYVEDVVDAIRLLLPSKIEGYQAINISSRSPVKTIDLVQLMGEITKVTPRIRVVSRPSYDVDVTHANLTLLDEIAVGRQETSFYDGIAKFVEWYARESATTSNRTR